MAELCQTEARVAGVRGPWWEHWDNGCTSQPCSASTQEPGPPSEPVGDLIAAIGAVAKLLTKAEIREDPEAQKAMDAEFYKLQGDGITGTWDLSQVRAKRDVMQEARKQEKRHIMVACLVSHR